MPYIVSVYEDISDEEDGLLESESFDSMDEALGYGLGQMKELAEDGEEVEQLEGAPDFVAEFSVVGTARCAVVRKSGLM